MKSLYLLVVAGGLAASGLAAPAQAAGCLTGAAVGGVAGHVAGHHGLLGAAVGCAIGHHHATVMRRERDNAAYRNDGNGNGGYRNDGNGAYRSGPDAQTYGRDAYRDDQQR